MTRADSAGSEGVRPATAHGSAMLVASSLGPTAGAGEKRSIPAPRRPSLGEGAAVPPGRVGRLHERMNA
jgi:hypothetical protein